MPKSVALDAENLILKERVSELEGELRERERDLKHFREELGAANVRMESLMALLERELSMAHRIQKALTPTELPQISGFEFSSKFIASGIQGADYFDVFEHEDRLRFGVVLATSSGHGMSALLLSVLLKLTRQMEARKSKDPSRILASVAEEVRLSLEGDAQSDILYGVMDRRSYDFNYCRAGQVLGFHLPSGGKTVNMLESSGSGLVRERHESFTAHKVALNPKDRVVLCSRGIVEALNRAGDAFGLERLIQVLATGPVTGVHELRNHILYEVERFTAGREIPRDQTVLVMEVKDRVIKLARKNQAH